MSILQNIFSNHFHKLLNSNIKIRDTVIENVDKMIHCGDFKRGYAFYICEHCSRFMVSPFSCRSRFCTSCGNLYKHCPNGFYVYAKPTLTNNQDVLKYIGRYLGRPVIAASRIDYYDGQFVTFHYNRHEDNKLITETVSAVDFIKKLIIHIPEKHFKLIRYYGIYAKHHKHENSLRLFIPKEKRRFHILRNSWRTSVSLSFHFDPLLCKCGHKMTLFQFCLNGTPFFEKSNSWINSS